VTTAPIPATPAGGVFSLAFRGPHRGVAVGGDFENEDNGVDASGYTHNGRTWTGGGDLGGYRSGVDWVAGSHRTLVAVGPSGSDVTRDGGRTWSRFSDTGFHSVVCVPGTCWASGTEGRVARLTLRR
jgi:enoyl-CoA hydratase/carnithine racemase